MMATIRLACVWDPRAQGIATARDPTASLFFFLSFFQLSIASSFSTGSLFTFHIHRSIYPPTSSTPGVLVLRKYSCLGHNQSLYRRERERMKKKERKKEGKEKKSTGRGIWGKILRLICTHEAKKWVPRERQVEGTRRQQFSFFLIPFITYLRTFSFFFSLPRS